MKPTHLILLLLFLTAQIRAGVPEPTLANSADVALAEANAAADATAKADAAQAAAEATAAADATAKVATLSDEIFSAAFFDDFDDRSRYPDGTLITHGTTPAIGDPWRLPVADSGSQTTDAPLVFGGVIANNEKLFYLGSTFDHEIGAFEMAFEATFDTSRHTGAIGTGILNISFSTSPNLIAPGGGSINVTNAIHANISMTGLSSLDFFNSGVTFQGNAGTDILTTSAAHGLQTGWPVRLGGAGIPAGVAAGDYFAIVLSTTTLKLAHTRSLALAATAIDLTTDGAATPTIAHGFELLNRRFAAGGTPTWVPRTLQRQKFQAVAATDIVATLGDYRTGDMVQVQGSGLPAPLAEDTEYYVYRSGSNIYLSTTADNAARGIYIGITTNGSADQILLGYASESVSLAADKRYVIIVRVEGEIVTYSVVGVGRLAFRSPRLAQMMAATTTTAFWWEVDGHGTIYQQVPRLHSVAANAPTHIERMKERAFASLWEVFTDTPRFQKGIQVLPTPKDRFAAGGIGGGTVLSGHGGGAVDVGGGALRPANGNILIQGLYAANAGLANVGEQVIGYAPMRLGIGLNTPLSSTAGAETVLLNLITQRLLAVGDSEEHVVNFQLVGASAKKIRISLNPAYAPTNILDTGTDLDALTGAGVLRIFRMAQTGANHVYRITLQVGSTVKIYPHVSFNRTETFSLRINTTTVDAGGIILDTGYREICRMTAN